MTTGRPKGAVLRHRNLAADADAVVRAWAWTSADCLIHALPMFHMHGLGVGLIGTFTAGASMVILNRFSIETTFRCSSAFPRCTHSWTRQVRCLHWLGFDCWYREAHRLIRLSLRELNAPANHL